MVAELADYLVGKRSAPHRGPLDGALPRRLLPRRWGPHERAGGHRPGALGHQGEGLRAAGAPAPGRAAAGPDPGVLLDRRRSTRPTPPPRRGRRWAAGFTAVKMNATEELQFVDSHARVDADHRQRRRGAGGGRPGGGHRPRLPRPGAPAHGQGAGEGARALPPDVHRGARPQRARRGPPGARRGHQRSHRARRAPVLPLGLQAGAGRRLGGHHPAGPIPRRRHYRDQEDRSHGRGLRRRARPALPAGAHRPRRLPAARRGLPTTPSSRSRASASTTTRAATCSIT